MDSPTKTEPPFVPLRHTGWASRRTPLWVFAAIIVLVAGWVLVSLSHKPSQAQRAGDLSGYFTDVNAGIESCAGGVHDSLTAYGKVAVRRHGRFLDRCRHPDARRAELLAGQQRAAGRLRQLPGDRIAGAVPAGQGR